MCESAKCAVRQGKTAHSLLSIIALGEKKTTQIKMVYTGQLSCSESAKCAAVHGRTAHSLLSIIASTMNIHRYSLMHTGQFRYRESATCAALQGRTAHSLLSIIASRVKKNDASTVKCLLDSSGIVSQQNVLQDRAGRPTHCFLSQLAQ